jgi:hypothetical protein
MREPIEIILVAIIAIVIIAIITVTAIGITGGFSKEEPPTPTPTPTSTATPTPTPTSTAAPTPMPTPIPNQTPTPTPVNDPQVGTNEVVYFPDPNLETVIREVIRRPTGDIYKSDLTRLTRLVAWDRGIVDLTGLEYCTSLTALVLSANQISDISALTSLTSLIRLDLTENQISDISALSSLTSVTRLDLRGNHISDISTLSSITRLNEVYLGGNQISDISALSSLTSLNKLFLNNNQISDVSPLVANAGLSGGDYLTLCINPLSTDSVITYVPELQGRGVYVACPVATAIDEVEFCFIATAAYGTESAEEIDMLRAFRDEVLLENSLGSQLVDWYYQTSPPVADFISENSLLRTIVRELVIDPMVSVATFTRGIWEK